MTDNLVFVTNQNSALAYREIHNGKQYLIAPYIPLVPGVLNGELLRPEEVAKFPGAWNGRPIVLRHPQKNGDYVSANDPDFLDSALGRIHNAQWVDGRLKWENWYDIERIQNLGGEALEILGRIERGEPTEGSTAYWRDVELISGAWRGKSYSAIARNLRPDHYAILPDELGACSWDDGCGGPRVNQRMEEEMLSTNGKRKLGNLMNRAVDAWITQETTRQKVVSSLAKKAELPESDFEKALAGQLEMDEETARRVANALGIPEEEFTRAMTPAPEPEPAANESYPSVVNQSFFSNLIANLIHTFRAKKEASMQDQLIAKIVANKCNRLTKEQLTAMDEPTLTALSESLEEAAPPADPPAPAPTPTPPTEEAPAWAAGLLKTVEEQGKLIQDLAGQFSANAAIARQPLVDFITANTQLYTAEMLAGMETEGLEKIYQLVAQASGKQVETPAPNYIGLGGRLGTNANKEEVAKPPSLIETIQKQRNGAAAVN